MSTYFGFLVAILPCAQFTDHLGRKVTLMKGPVGAVCTALADPTTGFAKCISCIGIIGVPR
jgi:fucose permease